MTIATEFQDRAAVRLRLARLMATRFATVGDQMLVALANFWLTVAIGRAFHAEELASYGIGLSAGLMVQALQRHAIVIPLILEPKSRVLRRCGAIMGQHWIILAVTLAIIGPGVATAAALGATGYGQQIIAAFGACLIVYSELEFARAIFIKLNKPLSLLMGSAFYTALCGGLGLGALTHWLDFPKLLALLAAAMTLHAVGVSIQVGDFSLARGWAVLRTNMRRYGAWSLVATGTYGGYIHFPLFLLGSLADPIHAATFVATRSVMQPLQILLRGLDLADKAAFAEKASAPHSHAAFLASLKLAGLYAIAGSAFSMLVAVFAEPLLLLTYGPKFIGAGPTLIAWGPVFILLGCMMPLESLVYARRRFRGYYFARAVGSVLAIALTAPLVFRFAEKGAILACAAGGFVAAAGVIFLLYRDTNQ
jgi:O-antigen/teichoic acid export membrane protein